MTIVIYEISWYLNSLRTLHNFLLLFFFRSFYHFDPINHHLNLNLTVQGPPLQRQSNLITLQSFHFIPISLLFYLLRLKHDIYKVSEKNRKFTIVSSASGADLPSTPVTRRTVISTQARVQSRSALTRMKFSCNSSSQLRALPTAVCLNRG